MIKCIQFRITASTKQNNFHNLYRNILSCFKKDYNFSSINIYQRTNPSCYANIFVTVDLMQIAILTKKWKMFDPFVDEGAKLSCENDIELHNICANVNQNWHIAIFGKDIVKHRSSHWFNMSSKIVFCDLQMSIYWHVISFESVYAIDFIPFRRD